MKFKPISPIFPYMENARTEFIRKQRDEYARIIDELENSGNPSDTAELERRRRRLAELDAELSKVPTGNPQMYDESVDFARDYVEFVKNIKAEKLKYAEFYKKLNRPAQATFYSSRPDNPKNGDMWTESDGGTFVQTDDGPIELQAVSKEPSVDVKLVDRSDDNPWATAMGETFTGYTGAQYTGITFEQSVRNRWCAVLNSGLSMNDKNW